jgi:hypothetical protein
LIGGNLSGGLHQKFGHFRCCGESWGMDVIDARPDLVRMAVGGECVEQFHLRARGLDRDYIGIHCADRGDDVVELGVAHVRVDLRPIRHAA